MLRIVALKLYHKSYKQLADLAATVIAGFTAQAVAFPAPNPDVATTVTTDLATLNSAIASWGEVGNRGSHNDLLAVRAARDVMRVDLTQLAEYAENTAAPGDRIALASIGWELKRVRQTVGILQAVQNLHQFVSRQVSAGTLKLKWEIPLGATANQVRGYKVLRSATPVFADAVQLTAVSKTSFTDASPARGINYYWIIPFNGGTGGDGVISDVCAATPVFLP